MPWVGDCDDLGCLGRPVHESSATEGAVPKHMSQDEVAGCPGKFFVDRYVVAGRYVLVLGQKHAVPHPPVRENQQMVPALVSLIVFGGTNLVCELLYDLVARQISADTVVQRQSQHAR
eukprot:scaffold510228_cov31-Prasinocladus_malaysianus.AAC.1